MCHATLFYDLMSVIMLITFIVLIRILCTVNTVRIFDRRPFDEYAHNACKIHKTLGFFAADPIGLVENFSLADCLLSCLHQKHCQSGTYFPSVKVCLMSTSFNRYKNQIYKAVDNSIYFVLLCKAVSYPNISTADSVKRKNICTSTMNRHGRSKRMFGGKFAAPYSQPWLGIVAINKQLHCGISLIAAGQSVTSTPFGLSAAHCFQKGGQALNTEKFDLLFGASDLRFATPRLTHRKISNVHIHPDFDLHFNDIAVVKFDRPVLFDNYINSLCLPDANDKPNLCAMCGYAETSEESSSQLSVIQCVRALFSQSVSSEDIAIGSTITSSRLRKGDSGNPMVCLVRNNFYVTGVVFGVSRYESSATEYSIHFVWVPTYLPWIASILASKSNTQKKSESFAQPKRVKCVPFFKFCHRLKTVPMLG